jgi:surface protein
MRKLLYLVLTVLIVACSSDDGGDGNDQSICNGDNPVYIANNGVTIKACEWANVGDTGVINGVTYTVVDEAMLREIVANEDDVTKLATTKVTDMFEMFFIDLDTPTDFNQDISNWDVSNVTDMGGMFYWADEFDQDISNWDVSNVTDMGGMFVRAFAFNQPIGNWDVSNVTDMSYMFNFAINFNQPIGDWDVSNVTDMNYMFYFTVNFNQLIGDWDVSNVTDMGSMFKNASFNQDIGGWNVSNVTNMYRMFKNAFTFNQDLSVWNVANVTNCEQFNSNTSHQWTLPKPNFTNCTP